MRMAARLYPAAWRARYGAEFEALMEDVAPQWRDVWNVAGGAMEMQMTDVSFWKLVPALGVAGAIVMAVVAFLVRPVYESGAVMRVTPTVVSEGQGEGIDAATAEFRRLDYLRTKTLGREALARIVADEKLYPGEKVENGVARMQQNLRFTMPAFQARGGHASLLVMSFRYPDAGKAQQVVKRLVDLMMEGNIAAQGQGLLASQVEILDAPRIPGGPIFPNRPLMIVVGLTAGLLLGALYCARSGWKVVLFCGAVGAPLGVYGFGLALGRHLPQSAIRPLAIMGFLAGLLIGLLAVMLRRKPAAG